LFTTYRFAPAHDMLSYAPLVSERNHRDYVEQRPRSSLMCEHFGPYESNRTGTGIGVLRRCCTTSGIVR
jgi:hypothetical protein